MLGIIGVGQGGGSIADLFASRGIKSIAINYSQRDLDALIHIEDKLKLNGSEGVGKDQQKAVNLFHNNYEATINFVKEHLSSPSIELILVVFSTAGGSGSGISPLLIELLMNEMDDKVFVACPILPTLSEATVNQLNTLNALSTLSELECCILPIDNEKGTQTEGKNKLYESVNSQFTDLILNVTNYPNESSPHENIDLRDMLTLFSTKGFATIGQCDISKISNGTLSLSKENVSQMVINSWQHSIFTEISSSHVIRSGVIYDGQLPLMSYIQPELFFQLFDNQPIDIFEGYYTNKNGTIYTILTGLHFNKNRLDKIDIAIDSNSKILQSIPTLDTSIQPKRHQFNVRNESTKPKKAVSDIFNKYKK